MGVVPATRGLLEIRPGPRAIALVSRGQPTLAILPKDGEQPREIRLPYSARTADWLTSDSLVIGRENVDCLYGVSTSSAATFVIGCDAGVMGLEKIAVNDDRVFFGRRLANWNYQIGQFDRRSGKFSFVSVPAPGGRPFSAYLNTTTNGVLITSIVPGDPVFFVDMALTIRQLGKTYVPADKRRWVALPLLRLRDTYVQTFSDLGSNMRLIVKYDLALRVSVVKRENEPLALFASDGPDYLYGSRQSGTVQILRFRLDSATPHR